MALCFLLLLLVTFHCVVCQSASAFNRERVLRSDDNLEYPIRVAFNPRLYERQVEPKKVDTKRMNSRHELDEIAPAELRHHQMAAESGNYRQLPGIQEQNYNHQQTSGNLGDIYFVAIVAGCSVAAISGVISAGYCFYKFQQHKRAAADVDYPAYGVIGPITPKPTSEQTLPLDGVAAGQTGQQDASPVIGDRKLAQSAQMYHYHHQKQQMIAAEKKVASTATTATGSVSSVQPQRTASASDDSDDDDNEDGEYTVYECPGLAPTCEMEVKNPLFQDDVTPSSAEPVDVAMEPSAGDGKNENQE